MSHSALLFPQWLSSPSLQVIGIAGLSGSGKTTLASELLSLLPSPFLPFSLDDFFVANEEDLYARTVVTLTSSEEEEDEGSNNSRGKNQEKKGWCTSWEDIRAIDFQKYIETIQLARRVCQNFMEAFPSSSLEMMRTTASSSSASSPFSCAFSFDCFPLYVSQHAPTLLRWVRTDSISCPPPPPPPDNDAQMEEEEISFSEHVLFDEECRERFLSSPVEKEKEKDDEEEKEAQRRAQEEANAPSLLPSPPHSFPSSGSAGTATNMNTSEMNANGRLRPYSSAHSLWSSVSRALQEESEALLWSKASRSFVLHQASFLTPDGRKRITVVKKRKWKEIVTALGPQQRENAEGEGIAEVEETRMAEMVEEGEGTPTNSRSPYAVAKTSLPLLHRQENMFIICEGFLLSCFPALQDYFDFFFQIECRPAVAGLRRLLRAPRRRAKVGGTKKELVAVEDKKESGDGDGVPPTLPLAPPVNHPEHPKRDLAPGITTTAAVMMEEKKTLAWAPEENDPSLLEFLGYTVPPGSAVSEMVVKEEEEGNFTSHEDNNHNHKRKIQNAGAVSPWISSRTPRCSCSSCSGAGDGGARILIDVFPNKRVGQLYERLSRAHGQRQEEHRKVLTYWWSSMLTELKKKKREEKKDKKEEEREEEAIQRAQEHYCRWLSPSYYYYPFHEEFLWRRRRRRSPMKKEEQEAIKRSEKEKLATEASNLSPPPLGSEIVQKFSFPSSCPSSSLSSAFPTSLSPPPPPPPLRPRAGGNGNELFNLFTGVEHYWGICRCKHLKEIIYLWLEEELFPNSEKERKSLVEDKKEEKVVGTMKESEKAAESMTNSGLPTTLMTIPITTKRKNSTKAFEPAEKEEENHLLNVELSSEGSLRRRRSSSHHNSTLPTTRYDGDAENGNGSHCWWCWESSYYDGADSSSYSPLPRSLWGEIKEDTEIFPLLREITAKVVKKWRNDNKKRSPQRHGGREGVEFHKGEEKKKCCLRSLYFSVRKALSIYALFQFWYFNEVVYYAALQYPIWDSEKWRGNKIWKEREMQEERKQGSFPDNPRNSDAFSSPCCLSFSPFPFPPCSLVTSILPTFTLSPPPTITTALLP